MLVVPGGVSASAVVDPHGLGDDRQPSFLAGAETLPVENVLLQRCDKKHSRDLVAAGANSSCRHDQAVASLNAGEGVQTDWAPRSACTGVPNGSSRTFRVAHRRCRQRRLHAEVDGVAGGPLTVDVVDLAIFKLILGGVVFGDSSQPDDVGRSGDGRSIQQVVVSRLAGPGALARRHLAGDDTRMAPLGSVEHRPWRAAGNVPATMVNARGQ